MEFFPFIGYHGIFPDNVDIDSQKRLLLMYHVKSSVNFTINQYVLTNSAKIICEK